MKALVVTAIVLALEVGFIASLALTPSAAVPAARATPSVVAGQQGAAAPSAVRPARG